MSSLLEFVCVMFDGTALSLLAYTYTCCILYAVHIALTDVLSYQGEHTW